MHVAASTTTPPPSQLNYGTFATLDRVPLVTAPHRLYFGDHVQSFGAFDDAVAAAKELSAGPGQAHVVTSYPEQVHPGWAETDRYNVYQVTDVTGPRITNPVIGWKDFNTTSRPYHLGNVPFVLSTTSWRSPELVPTFRDMLIVDGDETVQVRHRD